jgi:hypothetical protein
VDSHKETPPFSCDRGEESIVWMNGRWMGEFCRLGWVGEGFLDRPQLH